MEKDRQQETHISKFLAKGSAWVAQRAGEYSVLLYPTTQCWGQRITKVM